VKLVAIETFVTLCRLRHFGRTGEQLGATQPAVSARIASLERDLGARLIDRDARGFQLTAAGRAALPVMERIVADLRALRDGAAESDLSPRSVRIGAIDAIVQTWLPDYVGRVTARFPSADIEIVVESTVNLLVEMRNGRLDAAFCLEPALGAGYVNRAICAFAMAWVGSPQTIDPERAYGVEEIAAMPLIAYPRNTPPWRTIAQYFPTETALAGQRAHSNSLSTMVRLAADGFGVAAAPMLAVRRELASGELVAIRARKALAPLPIVATAFLGQGPAVADELMRAARDAAATAAAAHGPDLLRAEP
jgi:DNA-binding transcriptional LysR family regulator